MDGSVSTLIPIKPAQSISTEKCGKEIICLLISQGPTYQHQQRRANQCRQRRSPCISGDERCSGLKFHSHIVPLLTCCIFTTIFLKPHSPVAPSIDSRMKSAWPLCRAYSSIICTKIQRKLGDSPLGHFLLAS